MHLRLGPRQEEKKKSNGGQGKKPLGKTRRGNGTWMESSPGTEERVSKRKKERRRGSQYLRRGFARRPPERREVARKSLGLSPS